MYSFQVVHLILLQWEGNIFIKIMQNIPKLFVLLSLCLWNLGLKTQRCTGKKNIRMLMKTVQTVWSGLCSVLLLPAAESSSWGMCWLWEWDWSTYRSEQDWERITGCCITLLAVLWTVANVVVGISCTCSMCLKSLTSCVFLGGWIQTGSSNQQPPPPKKP